MAKTKRILIIVNKNRGKWPTPSLQIIPQSTLHLVLVLSSLGTDIPGVALNVSVCRAHTCVNPGDILKNVKS